MYNVCVCVCVCVFTHILVLFHRCVCTAVSHEVLVEVQQLLSDLFRTGTVLLLILEA